MYTSRFKTTFSFKKKKAIPSHLPVQIKRGVSIHCDGQERANDKETRVLKNPNTKRQESPELK